MIGLVGVIPGKKLIPPLARKRHGDVLSSQVRNDVCGDDRCIGQRFVQIFDQLWDEFSHQVRLYDEFLVVCLEAVSHDLGISQLVKSLLLEADGKGLYLGNRHFAHQRCYGTRVHSTTEEDTQWDITDQSLFHGFFQPLVDLLHDRLFACVGIGVCCVGDVPIWIYLGFCVGDDDHMSGQELLDAFKDRLGGWNVFECEETRHAVKIQLSLIVGLQDGFYLGGKNKSLIRLPVVERFDPKTISCETECIRLFIPEGYRKHAIQSRNKVLPFFFIEMSDDFCV